MNDIIPIENITGLIYLIRGKKVILDRDLAVLYGVETKVFKQAVRRNIDRFPEDFMFELTKPEFMKWRSQFVTSNSDKMGLRYNPMAFTEQGVAMLSSVLRSKTAIQINIQIMRAFTKVRHFILDNVELRRELEGLRVDMDEKFRIVFETFDHLLAVESQPRKKIGFTVKEKQARYGKQDNKDSLSQRPQRSQRSSGRSSGAG